MLHEENMGKRYELKYGRWVLEEKREVKKKPYVKVSKWSILSR